MAPIDVFEVVAPGILSSVQDLGRYGYARFGVAPSGALDTFALRTANILAGNPEGVAAVETTLMGLRLRALADVVVAVTGGDLDPRCGRTPLPMWAAREIRAGETLSFNGPRSGFRAYFAVAGGIRVPAVMGSRATNLPSGFGGFEGRLLRRGDILQAEPGPDPVGLLNRTVAPGWPPLSCGGTTPWRVRVLRGPQDADFTDDARSAFTGGGFTVSPDSDRTGLRLKGPQLACRPGVAESIVSEGVLAGAIQVPSDGQPIVILGETVTGGYRKIATVISADLPLLGQIKPGDEVRFDAVSMDAAIAALKAVEAKIESLKKSLDERAG
jgi:biotin-dependent carboxylase-like uncharacterized protein